VGRSAPWILRHARSGNDAARVKEVLGEIDQDQRAFTGNDVVHVMLPLLRYPRRGADWGTPWFAEMRTAPGTHAISIALFGVLRPGDELLYITGKPYDTLEEIVGLRGNGVGSLKEFGISYDSVALTDEGRMDWTAIADKIKPNTKMIGIQRSKGYATRPSFTVAEIGEMIRFVKEIKPDVVVFVDVVIECLFVCVCVCVCLFFYVFFCGCVLGWCCVCVVCVCVCVGVCVCVCLCVCVCVCVCCVVLCCACVCVCFCLVIHTL